MQQILNRVDELGLIDSLKDIRKNIQTFEKYLNGRTTDDSSFRFAKTLLRFGTTLIAYKVGGELHFAPSNFVGYKNNTREKYLQTEPADFRRAISAIDTLGICFLEANKELDSRLTSYCNSLGIEDIDRKRAYWLFDLKSLTFLEVAQYYKEKRCRTLYEREQIKPSQLTPVLMKKVKRAFQREHQGEIFCEACGFNSLEVYGVDCIEIHVSEQLPQPITNLEELKGAITLLCPNCHRAMHSKSPAYTLNEVKQKMRKSLAKTYLA